MSPSTIRNVIISSILTGLIVVIFVFTLSEVNAQGKKLLDQIKTLQEYRAQQDSYLQLKRLADESKSDRELLRSFFLLKESDSIDFLYQVEDLASEIGVTLDTSNNNVGTVKDKKDDSEWVEVSYSVVGSRERVQSFIKILEKMQYVSRLMSVDMRALSKTEWQAKVKLRVRLLTYDE